MQITRTRRMLTVLAIAAAFVAPAIPAQADAPTPTLVEVGDDVGIQGHPMWDPWFDLDAFGYESHEYFVSGTATATGSDTTADYTTRIVVVHPSDPADFSGTVMLDWVNVTAQFENAVNSLTSVEFLLREGWAWAHVSAQAAGICCTPALTPKTWDPVRYADLSHPGDDYSYDMFSQIAQAFKQPGDVHPLRGMTAEIVLAAGQSQGGSRVSGFISSGQALDRTIDGILQQAGGTKNYETAPPIPVIHLLGDREGSVADPTPWPTYRLWEVAGAAHQDSWVGRQQTEGASTRVIAGVRQSRGMAEALWESAGQYGEIIDPRAAVCIVNGALLPNRYVANAALAALDTWARGGEPAPTGARYEFDGTGLAKDSDQNTLGGIRLAPMTAPVATYIADSCNLGGITIPFTEAQIIQRYGDHQTYFDLMYEQTQVNLADGHILPADADDLLRRACAARVRFLDPSTGDCVPTNPAPAPQPEPTETPAPSPTPTATPSPAVDPLPATGGGAASFALAAFLLALVFVRPRPVRSR